MLSVGGHSQPKTRQHLKFKHNKLRRNFDNFVTAPKATPDHPFDWMPRAHSRGKILHQERVHGHFLQKQLLCGNVFVQPTRGLFQCLYGFYLIPSPPKKKSQKTPTANSAFGRFSHHTSIFVDFELRMWGTSWAKTSNINQLLLIAAFCNERFSRWSWPWLKAQDSVMKTHPANQWTNTTGP